MNIYRTFLFTALCAVQSLYSLEQQRYLVDGLPTHVKILNGLTAYALSSFMSSWGQFWIEKKLDDSLKASFAVSVISSLSAGATALLLEQRVGTPLSSEVITAKRMLKVRQALVGVGAGMMTPFAAKKLFDYDTPIEMHDLVMPVAGAAVICVGLCAGSFFKKRNKDN